MATHLNSIKLIHTRDNRHTVPLWFLRTIKIQYEMITLFCKQKRGIA